MSLKQFVPPENSLEACVANWIACEEKLNAAKQLDGGWEGWAQVQLALHVQNSTQAAVSREAFIYLTEPERADLWVKPRNDPNVGQHDSRNYGLELKCRTKGEIGTKFQKRFLDDIDKVKRGLRTDAKPCVMCVMGITDSPMETVGWDQRLGENYTTFPGSYFQVGGWIVIFWCETFPL